MSSIVGLTSAPVASASSFPLSYSSIAYATATASSASPYNPEIQPGLTAAQLSWLCQSINAGVYIGAMAWGLHTAVFYKTIGTVLKSSVKSRWIWLPFVGTLWAMGTINMACNIKVNEYAFIDSTGYDGGAFAYDSNIQRYPVTVAALAVGIINLSLADIFLIYRVHALWRRLYITIPLGMLCVVSSSFAILLCFSAANDYDQYWTGPAAYLSGGQIYGAIMGTLHTLFAILLLWRILDLRRKSSGGLTTQSRANYVGIKAIVVESALPYGIISFALMIMYCLNNAGANLFVPLLVQLEGIVPELIIARIVSGYAWSLDEFLAINEKMPAFCGESGPSVSVPDREDVSMTTLVTESYDSMDKKVLPAYVVDTGRYSK